MRLRATTSSLILAVSVSAFAAQANWEGELREMGYMFLHISNINVVNGLNLTREQAVKLRALALQVEAAAARPPSFRAPMSPEMAGCRKAWLELRDLLLEATPVPADLERRVNEGRAAESRVVRATLRPAPAAPTTQCTSCHAAPSQGQGEPMAATPSVKRLMDAAHTEGVYGRQGIWKCVQLSPQVDAILTDAQKAILGSFSCCLVPPQSLSDPVRAGQAESSEKALEMLRNIRKCPDGMWPTVRAGILQKAEQITNAASPGATDARRAAARDGVGKALDRARACSDVEFEMEKDDLSKAVRGAIVSAPRDGPHKAAYFLLIPGASEVYAAYLRRSAPRR